MVGVLQREDIRCVQKRDGSELGKVDSDYGCGGYVGVGIKFYANHDIHSVCLCRTRNVNVPSNTHFNDVQPSHGHC